MAEGLEFPGSAAARALNRFGRGRHRRSPSRVLRRDGRIIDRRRTISKGRDGIFSGVVTLSVCRQASDGRDKRRTAVNPEENAGFWPSESRFVGARNATESATLLGRPTAHVVRAHDLRGGIRVSQKGNRDSKKIETGDAARRRSTFRVGRGCSIPRSNCSMPWSNRKTRNLRPRNPRFPHSGLLHFRGFGVRVGYGASTIRGKTSESTIDFASNLTMIPPVAPRVPPPRGLTRPPMTRSGPTRETIQPDRTPRTPPRL